MSFIPVLSILTFTGTKFIFILGKLFSRMSDIKETYP